MWLRLSPIHIDTICQLKEIAAKHNCKIAIYVEDHNAHSSDDAISSILEHIMESDHLSQEDIDSLTANYDFTNAHYTHDIVCFELIEPSGKETPFDRFTYHQMIYRQFNLGMECEYHESWDTELSEEAEKWADNNVDYDYFYKEYDQTDIKGFPGVDTSKTHVYREGMAVKFFGDLVCDYLGEPRIIKTY